MTREQQIAEFRDFQKKFDKQFKRTRLIFSFH